MTCTGQEGVWVTGGLDPKAVGALRNTGMDPPGKSQSYPASNQSTAIMGPPAKLLKWCFAGGQMMASFVYS